MRILSLVLAMLLATPVMAMGKSGNSNKNKATIQVAYADLLNEDSNTVVELEGKTTYNFQITEVPSDIVRARLKKEKGQSSKFLKIRSKKEKIKNGTMNNKIKTGKGVEPFLGLANFSSFVDLIINDPLEDDTDDEMALRQARLVSGDDTFAIRFIVKDLNVCPTDFAPVCGLLTFSETNTVQQTFNNECSMSSSGATKVSDGECVTPPAI